MIYSEKGNVKLQGSTEDIVNELTFAMVQVLALAKCRDRAKLMNLGMSITSNAIDILHDVENEKMPEMLKEQIEQNAEKRAAELVDLVEMVTKNE